MSAAAVLAAQADDPGFPLLTTVVLLPAVGAVVVALLPRAQPSVARILAAAVSIATGVLTIFTAIDFETHAEGFQFVSEHPWIADFGIAWKVGVDGISLWLLVLSGVLFPIAILGPPVKRDVKSYMAWMLVLETGCLGVFVALDLFLFFVFFEIVLVPMYFLIAGWGYDQRVYASLKFFLYTLAGSAFLLVGMLTLVFLHQRATGELTFDLVRLGEAQSVTGTTARWLFVAFTVAFAVKVPIFPVHTWLPDAHTEAPTAGSLDLAGLLLKTGLYGLIRIAFP
ncbi:MAG TPA: NADH-quinone oxidoreductase subunit M, partial [Acidimicrobiales bacterium]|nr:NADH-quinone oxidoreductase subunit M [Acidimicrobiales bacterium]